MNHKSLIVYMESNMGPWYQIQPIISGMILG